jgi:hypothetical protein
MAYTCDNPHPEPTPAFTVMSMPETGDTNALCVPCLLDWAYAMLAGTEAGTELLKSKMLEIAAEAKAAEAKASKRGRRAVPEAAAPGEATEAIAAATDTPETD